MELRPTVTGLATAGSCLPWAKLAFSENFAVAGFALHTVPIFFWIASNPASWNEASWPESGPSDTLIFSLAPSGMDRKNPAASSLRLAVLPSADWAHWPVTAGWSLICNAS